MTQFTVCTYDLGNITAYEHLNKYNNPTFEITNREKSKPETLLESYESAQRETSELISGSEVYLLQGVGNKDRIFLKNLEEKTYTLIYLENSNSFETAIALSSKRFRDIENLSQNIDLSSGAGEKCETDVSIAVATDTLSGQQLVFASAYAPKHDRSFKINLRTGSYPLGYSYCKKVAELLNKIAGSHLQVLGINVNENDKAAKLKDRISNDFLEKAGYQAMRTIEHTQVYFQNQGIGYQPALQKWRTDFIFLKSNTSLLQKARWIFEKSFQVKGPLISFNPLEWDPKKNASNHIAIFAEIHSEVKEPFFGENEAKVVTNAVTTAVAVSYLVFLLKPFINKRGDRI
jgi:hypothetical protein